MSRYPNELDKETIKWLRTYGYTLNFDDERYQKIKSKIKELYPYNYYMWIDLDIKKEAESLVPTSERYWERKFVAMKRKLVKEKYGLIK